MLPLIAGAAALASAGFLGYHSLAPRSQFFGKTFIGTPGKGRKLALTYDDGPNDPDTLLLLDVLESTAQAMFKFTGYVMAFAPIGVFAAIAATIGSKGVAILFTLGKLVALMYFGLLADSHAVLPAFLLGLAVAKIFHQHRLEQQRFRVVAFAFLTPFFFLKGGMNISLAAVVANLGLVGLLLAVKLAAKIIGVYPLARRYVPQNAWYTTLLMSTGLTFGTISSLYGLNAGIIDQAQFSVLVMVVVLTAIVPTAIAQRWFTPMLSAEPAGPALQGSEAAP